VVQLFAVTIGSTAHLAFQARDQQTAGYLNRVAVDDYMGSSL
jgi:hypothetical protein